MHYTLKQKALDKVPDLAAEIRAYYGEDVDIEQTVEQYTQRGQLWTTDRFIIGDLVLLQHIRLAKRKGYAVTFCEDDQTWEVQVRRDLSNGEYIIAHYRPYKA